ncbi:choice-of-anchor P family protein [Lentzea sp. NPDC092896]|uniref:choice-of-anchor P family protein n=1 Tax=Lentzea sp. NPDC092896 TaxID=3364127 RepID=UPI00382019C6
MSRARLAMALTIGLVGASVVFAPSALADHFVSKTFQPTGGEQTYTIPAGVRKLHVVAIGGRGGKGADGGDDSAPSGRPGHRSEADLAVPAGVTQLVVGVGQNGGDGNGATGGDPGYGGGASGGFGTPFAGGAGGGASDVRICSGQSCDKVLVAPGGGGGGGRCFAIGCLSGNNGGNGGDNNGGAPGIPGPGGFPGFPGILGLAGVGAPGNPATAGGGGGGGGGGGWYGGGGGASGAQAPTPLIVAVDGGSGGNGSARAGAGTSNFSTGETADEPSVTISYLVESTTITYTGPTSGFTGDPVTLSARLTTATGPVPEAQLVFRLNADETCVGTTDTDGRATCSITPAESAGTYPLAVGYGGDVTHQPSSTEVQFAVTRKPTTLTYTGALTGDFHDPATTSARLTLTGPGTPVASQPVEFKLNNAETCTGTTNADGVASCSLTPGEPAGTYQLTAAFAGSKGLLPSNAATDFAVTKEETSLTYQGDTKVANAEPARLSAKLTEDDATPVAGRGIQLTLGGTQSCVDTTDAAGLAECTIASPDQPLNAAATVPVTAMFTGDQFYEPSNTSATLALRHLTGRGFGLSGKAAGLTVAPTPDTGEVRTAKAATTAPPCAATVSAPVGAWALCTSVTTTLAPGTSTTRTSVAELGISLVALRDVVATSRSACGTTTGNVTIGALTVAGVAVPVATAPNTTISLPGGKIVINEQVPVPGGLKVNGAHITLPGVDLVVSSATSAIHNC